MHHHRRRARPRPRRRRHHLHCHRCHPVVVFTIVVMIPGRWVVPNGVSRLSLNDHPDHLPSDTNKLHEDYKMGLGPLNYPDAWDWRIWWHSMQNYGIAIPIHGEPPQKTNTHTICFCVAFWLESKYTPFRFSVLITWYSWGFFWNLGTAPNGSTNYYIIKSRRFNPTTPIMMHRMQAILTGSAFSPNQRIMTADTNAVPHADQTAYAMDTSIWGNDVANANRLFLSA